MDAIAGFFEANAISILNGLARGLLLFTLAVGLNLIFGLMDVLNLAHGALFLIGAYIGFSLAPSGESFLLAVVVATAVGLAAGVVLAAAVRPIRGRGHLDQALLTLGFAFMLSDLTSIIWGEDFRSLPPPDFLSGSTGLLGTVYPTYRLAVIGVGLALAVGVYLLFERTMLGAQVRAAVADRTMVSALGINTNRVLFGVMAGGVGLATFGGIVGAPVLGVRPGLDWDVLIVALIVVVVGGLGSIAGAFVAAILIGEVQSLGVALAPDIAAFLLFGTMALVLLVRPEGLFGDVTT